MKEDNKNKLAFTRVNYMIMLAGIAFIIIGFTIMALETEPQGFGFFGLTLGPIVVMLGFMIQFVAILYKPKSNK